MNAVIQSQLDRVETALNTLIDSISSYNPSPAAAFSLVAADDKLAEGLEQRKIPHSLKNASPTFLLTSPTQSQLTSATTRASSTSARKAWPSIHA